MSNFDQLLTSFLPESLSCQPPPSAQLLDLILFSAIASVLFLKLYVYVEPKTLKCPVFDRETAAANCFTECHSDDDCDNTSKCCSTGCGRICVKPSEPGQGRRRRRCLGYTGMVLVVVVVVLHCLLLIGGGALVKGL